MVKKYKMGRVKVKRTIRKHGAGLITSTLRRVGDFAGSVINKAIDVLPVELHLPGYQYCGPGTKLEQRLRRGDPGINKLDQACKQHDIAYSQFSDTVNRAKADKELAERAWQRVWAKDSGYGEKAAAWAITNAMKVKSKIGGGRVRRRTNCMRKRRGKGLYLRPYPTASGSGLKKKKQCRRRRHRRH